MLSRISAAACGLAVTACAIHPLPENVARLDTFAIVEKIRCEARDAVREAAAYFLENAKGDPYASDSGRKLREKTMDFADLDVASLGAFTRFFILKYENSAIAYDFTFDITEQNDLSTQIDLAGLISRGTISIPIKANNDRSRQTVRNFRISDKFGDLRKLRACGAGEIFANYVYPITGTIGLREVVTTFIDLNENQSLTGPKDSQAVPLLADTFNFQTNFGGSLAPKIALSPIRPPLDVETATLTSVASRRDTHKVIVALSLPVDPKSLPPETTARDFGVIPGLRKARPRARSGAEQRALQELDYQVQRSIINNLGVRPF